MKVTYVYNLNDGEGAHTITKELAITTLAKATPDFTITNTAKGQESLNFSVSVTDIDAVGAITKVELIHGTEITVLSNATVHEIKQLLSNNDLEYFPLLASSERTTLLFRSQQVGFSKCQYSKSLLERSSFVVVLLKMIRSAPFCKSALSVLLSPFVKSTQVR